MANPRGSPGAATPGETAPLNPVMSIDLEDWFQVENLRGAISRESWDEQPRRVVRNTETILEILERNDTTATFFCLGWVAERHPELIRRIAGMGHEIASHGYSHRLIYEQGAGEFRDDIIRAKALLEDITGEEVLGYRAPSFSITAAALEVLAETGHRYDSSWFPAGGHDRYGKLDMEPLVDWSLTGTNPDSVLTLKTGLKELIITTLPFAHRHLPWGGGGYFRLYPPRLFRYGFRRAMRRAGGGVFYLHPWEVDPGQPRVTGLPRSYAFRHYINLKHTASRLERICRTFTFRRADLTLGLRAQPLRR